MGEIAQKTEHSTARGDVRTWQIRRAAILLLRREKVETTSYSARTSSTKTGAIFRGIFNRKKADIGVAKTPKVLLDVDV